MSSRPMTAIEWLTLVALSVLWGGSFLFGEIALAELPPFTIVATRVTLAALALCAALCVLRLRLPPDRHVWRAFFAMGIFNNAIPFSLILYGQTQIASGLASILNATTPLFTALVAHRFAGEPLTARRIAGIVLGFLGVIVLVGQEAHGLRAGGLAQLACLAAALSYACAGVYGRRFRTLGVPALSTAAGQVVGSSLILVPVAIAIDRPWSLPFPGSATIASLVALGVLSTALAYVLYFRLLASAGATNLLLVTFLIPATAILLGALVLGEHLERHHVIGMALIGAGLAAMDGRLRRHLTSRARAVIAAARGAGSP
jgi:drug/metabolite transporter (DMT)-like permease